MDYQQSAKESICHGSAYSHFMFVDLLGSKGCNMGGLPNLLTILNIHKTGTNRAHFSKIGDHFPEVWFYKK